VTRALLPAFVLASLLAAGNAVAQTNSSGTVSGTATDSFTLTNGTGTGLCTSGFNPEPRVTVTSPMTPGGIVAVRLNLCGSPSGNVLTWRLLDRPVCFSAVDTQTPYNTQAANQFKSTEFVLQDKSATYVMVRLRVSNKPACMASGLTPVRFEAFYGDLRSNSRLANAALGPLHVRTTLAVATQPVL
jgi:hypothetical protein